jgi:hypothetical protein
MNMHIPTAPVRSLRAMVRRFAALPAGVIFLVGALLAGGSLAGALTVFSPASDSATSIEGGTDDTLAPPDDTLPPELAPPGTGDSDGETPRPPSGDANPYQPGDFVLHWVEATPSALAAGNDITLTWRIANPSGVWFTTAFLRTPSDSWMTNCGGGSATRIAGDERDGTYRQTCFIPDTVANGTWSVYLQSEERGGDSFIRESAATFQVTGGSNDTSSPVIASGSASPSTVTAGDTVTLTWRLTDTSGVTFTTAFLRNPEDQWVNGCGGGGVSRLSGTARDGTYQMTCRIPVSAVNGRYTMWIHAEDPNGNTRSAAAPGTFTVTGGGDDRTVPELVAIDVTPGDLAPGASFTIRWRVRDASGISFTTAFVNSPTGANVSGCGGSEAVRTSGTDLDGTYTQTCTLSVAARAGTYTVRIQAIDESGNQISGGANATLTVTVPTTTSSTTSTTLAPDTGDTVAPPGG